MICDRIRLDSILLKLSGNIVTILSLKPDFRKFNKYHL